MLHFLNLYSHKFMKKRLWKQNIQTRQEIQFQGSFSAKQKRFELQVLLCSPWFKSEGFLP